MYYILRSGLKQVDAVTKKSVEVRKSSKFGKNPRNCQKYM